MKYGEITVEKRAPPHHRGQLDMSLCLSPLIVSLSLSLYFSIYIFSKKPNTVFVHANLFQSLDPHYKYKHETVFISELTDRDQGIFSWSRHNSKKSTDFLKLIMKGETDLICSVCFKYFIVFTINIKE